MRLGSAHGGMCHREARVRNCHQHTPTSCEVGSEGCPGGQREERHRPPGEAIQAGGLFGTKVVLNEFVAFIDLGALKDLSAPTVGIVTFALCGFANFSSIAIQMAVTGSLAPNQRPMIAKLGVKALAAGSLSNLMSAALAGLFLSLT